MDIFKPATIPEDQVKIIVSFIKEKLAEYEGNDFHVNEIIRADIFRLLDSECVVIYYPSSDSNNNGFHKSYKEHGKDIHFVYINTAQHKEKQIFTAAHELGHIWRFDEYLEKYLDVKISDEHRECLMNRFAAELLMPKDLFSEFTEQTLSHFADEHKHISLGNMFIAITEIMGEFFVPYKSVVYRLYELGNITEETAKTLWGDTDLITMEQISGFTTKVAKELGYLDLFKADNKKLIDGLKDLLDKAKAQNLLPSNWLDSFYNRFDLKYEVLDGALESTISITSEEGMS